ncbi:MAG: hypothetical protein KHX49_00200 [Lachnospiraceae bacterium]|nr:hypothetical protein [Lachnospiraceae bacterium]
MQVYNYAAFAKVFELGVTKPNMTKIAKVLFEPIVSLDGVVNRVGNLYVIDSKYAKAWYEQTTDIPENIKQAATRQNLLDNIGAYFNDNIIDEVVSETKAAAMYSALIRLIRNSDLADDLRDELFQLYDSGELPDFLGRAFLYSLIADNTIRSSDEPFEAVDEDIRTFKEIIKRNHKKPKSIAPPKEIEDHEIGYVRELYRVYEQISGQEYARPEDLDAEPKLKKNFNRQRKDYYLAETIHRELRDTIRLDEEEGFNLLKDEVYDGVITTCEKDYDTGMDRMTAVMEHATEVPLSYNLQDRMLDWIGPGEKKGVCHMLVNDNRIGWMEEEDEDES